MKVGTNLHCRVLRACFFMFTSGSPNKRSNRFSARTGAVRVLVAEDDEALRSVLERGLQRAGYVVDAVADGYEALEYFKAYDYAVAIVDWRMPKMSGIELVQSLRRSGAGVPVLMLTARDMPSDRVLGLDEGVDDYMVKPFDFPELLARLRALQ